MTADRHGPAVAAHAAASALAGFGCTVVWGATGGPFWPVWVWLGLLVALAVHVALRWAIALEPGGVRAVGIVGSLTVVLAATHFAVWALSGGGYYWPIFPNLATATVTAVLAMVVFRERLFGTGEGAELAERVDELTRTRRGVLDVQADELRRIERDLHDGAQARLVALSMHLGRAEERLGDRPEVAELVRQARGEASAAIGELRDLARGIAPPVLADRGLGAAVEALARRSAVPVTTALSVPATRPPVVIETAAYFVVSEALTNVAKHAPAASAHVTIATQGDLLVVQITDDGPGGADPRGAGLTGLRHRAEAVDGRLTVTAGDGGGTLVRAELPCG